MAVPSRTETQRNKGGPGLPTGSYALHCASIPHILLVLFHLMFKWCCLQTCQIYMSDLFFSILCHLLLILLPQNTVGIICVIYPFICTQAISDPEGCRPVLHYCSNHIQREIWLEQATE